MIADIEKALFAKVSAMVLAPVLRVAFPNSGFVPNSGETYLEIRHFPAGNDRLFLGSAEEHKWIGVLQILIVSKVDVGTLKANEVADAILPYFATDTKLESNGVVVRVTKTPEVNGGFVDGVNWRLPISIRYESFN